MSDEYEVGYGKPPKHSPFKKGKSGNPNGRPKGTKNLRTDLIEELGEKIPVREGDRPTKISKQRAFVKTLVARSLKGDARAATTLMNLMLRVFDLGDVTANENLPLTSEECELFALIEERMKNRTNGGGLADQGSGGDGTS
jgi:uncharacterized protein DUF5681